MYAMSREDSWSGKQMSTILNNHLLPQLLVFGDYHDMCQWWFEGNTWRGAFYYIDLRLHPGMYAWNTCVSEFNFLQPQSIGCNTDYYAMKKLYFYLAKPLGDVTASHHTRTCILRSNQHRPLWWSAIKRKAPLAWDGTSHQRRIDVFDAQSDALHNS